HQRSLLSLPGEQTTKRRSCNRKVGSRRTGSIAEPGARKREIGGRPERGRGSNTAQTGAENHSVGERKKRTGDFVEILPGVGAKSLSRFEKFLRKFPHS